VASPLTIHHPPRSHPPPRNNKPELIIFPYYNHSFDSSQPQQYTQTMYRPLFLIAALPAFFGTFGHSYLGERDIFPKLLAAKTGLQPAQLRILRITWHTTSLTFAFLGSTLTVLGLKTSPLSQAEHWICIGISIWFALCGIACLTYWDKTMPQGSMFLAITGIILAGLRMTP